MRVPATPRLSRFREEFDMEPQAVPATPSRRRSIINKLKKRFTLNRFDGPKDMEDLLSIPIPDFAPKDIFQSGGRPKTPGLGMLSPGDPLSPGSGSDHAASLWGMAVKSQAEQKASAIGQNLHLPPPKKKSQDLRKKSVAGEDSHDAPAISVFGQLTRNMSFKKKKKVDLNDHESAAKEYQKRFQERVAAKEQVMDSWEAEMAATAKKAQDKSKNIVKKNKPTGPDKRYPPTWARYPSHTRSERSTSAGRRDRIDAKDFAIAKTTEDGEPIWYHGEKRYHRYHYDNDDDPSHEGSTKDMKQRIGDKKHRAGDKIKYKKYRLDKVTEQGASGHARGRRSSLTVSAKLAYPELEILPITLRTQAQQEQDVYEEEKNKVKELRRNFVVSTVVDGSAEEEEKTEFAINDPRFYADCIAEAAELVKSIRSTSTKYRTWSGRGRHDYADGSARRGRILRKSTDDLFNELQIMEREEREKLLATVEEYWGEKKRVSV